MDVSCKADFRFWKLKTCLKIQSGRPLMRRRETMFTLTVGTVIVSKLHEKREIT